MDVVAQRYGVRPSQLVNGDLSDFCLDLFVASISIERERKANKSYSEE